ncbi:alpha-amylase family glycosyl hydrolase [Peribacillus sp. SCS-155]|uniref:alpha-amylase family glycosyl hydrolase n=1 Tax=Peribacillus sedimenti TaxID=3115297 RepID=UPI003905F944
MGKRVVSLILIPFLLFYAVPASAVEKEERNWQDEIIYFMMIDRFNDGDTKNDKNVNVNEPGSYNGGDFKGIIDKLDYIKDMGFTAIWLTPVFDNMDKGYHGYWVKDFYKTDEHFGTLTEFKQLVKEAHKRNLKVISDFVVNHVGYNHPWLNDPEKKDWFHEKQPIENWDDQTEVENGWLYDLPDLNQDNPETRKYLLDAAKWWIDETDIDGYRLDAVKHVPKDFWADFAKTVKAEKQNFYLLGEVWDNDSKSISDYEKTGIDGFLDFPKNEQLRQAFMAPDGSLEGLFTVGAQNKELYKNAGLLGTFIDNHDMTRFTYEAVNNRQNPGTRWKMALSYMYTTTGIPIIYYGSEIALNGGEEPDNRKLMAFKAEKDLIDYITRLAELRKKHPALVRGETELLYDKDGMAVFKREYEGETLFVAVNNSSKSQTVTIDDEDLAKDKELRGLLEGDLVRGKDGKYSIILDREQTEVYKLADESGINIAYMATLAGVYAAFAAFIILVLKRSRHKQS